MTPVTMVSVRLIPVTMVSVRLKRVAIFLYYSRKDKISNYNNSAKLTYLYTMHIFNLNLIVIVTSDPS